MKKRILFLLYIINLCFIFDEVTADWNMPKSYLIVWSYYNQLFLIVPYQFSYYFCFLIYSWNRLFDHYLKQIIPNVSGVTFIEEGKLIWINRSILRQVTFMGIFSIFNLIVRLDICIITIGFFYTLYYLFIKFIYWVYSTSAVPELKHNGHKTKYVSFSPILFCTLLQYIW